MATWRHKTSPAEASHYNNQLGLNQPATYHHVKSSKARIQIHQGGTRSGKTFSITQCLIEWCWQNRDCGWVITIVRKTFPSLRASVLRDFISILEGQGWYNPALHNKSEQTYKLFGNIIEFISVDQPEKIRGRKRNILFVNECTELTREDWRQLIMRTTDRAIIDYNPADEFHWIYDDLIPRDDSDFFQTTYLDNPYLEPEVIAEIERLKETDSNYWRIYGLGERGVSQATVFPEWQHGEVPEQAKLVAVGLDWGYTNDPTAVVKVYKHGHDLYLDEVLYMTGLTNPDLVRMLQDKLEPRMEIVADSAEPKSIEELHRHGLLIKPSRKGPDSIRMGIDVMKRHRLYVTPSSLNLIKEMRNYKWKVDKNDRQLNQPVDAMNHAVDAVRYVCLNHLTKSRTGQYHIR